MLYIFSFLSKIGKLKTTVFSFNIYHVFPCRALLPGLVKMNDCHPMRNARNLSHEEIVQAISLVNDGRSQRYVGRVLSVRQSTISKLVRRYRETGGYKRRPGQGRKRSTTAIDDRFLRLTALRIRHCTARQIKNELLTVRNVNVTSQTVRNRLREQGIRARIPAKGPILTREHRIHRLQFARDHRDWTAENWANILFTDESRYCLFSSDRRLPVYRRDGERFSQCNFRNTTNFGGGSIMIWGGVSSEAKTELVVIRNGSMTADRYIRFILEPHVVPFAPYIGPNFRLMHDNARPHIANIVRNYLNEVDIRVLEWPARSPDMNPIEHVWDHIGWKLQTRQVPTRTLEELEAAVNEEWNQVGQDYIRGLFESLPRRMAAVIRARGGNTHY